MGLWSPMLKLKCLAVVFLFPFWIIAIGQNAQGVTLAGEALASQPLSNARMQYSDTLDYTAVLNTTMGNIVIELFEDMPTTTGDFKNLTQWGLYDGTLFDKIVHNSTIQGGDVTSKHISVARIPNELPNKHSNIRGSVGRVRASSAFYINLRDNSFLDSTYAVFGQVVQGMDVVDSIGNISTDSNNHPLQSVTILNAQLSGQIPEYPRLILLMLFITATLFAGIICARLSAERPKKKCHREGTKS